MRHLLPAKARPKVGLARLVRAERLQVPPRSVRGLRIGLPHRRGRVGR